MKTKFIFAAGLAAMGLFTGCQSIPPGAERGPNGTMAYNVVIQSSVPGVRIQANGEDVGTTPLTLKIFGDPDGTFHDFGSYEYVIQAFPNSTNQFTQTRVFRTGKMMTPEDYIPHQIYFDMSQPPATYEPRAYPPPAYYPYPSPYYYYGPPAYIGPRIYIGPRFHHRRHW